MINALYEYLHNSTPLSYVFEVYGTSLKCSNFIIEDIIIENDIIRLETDACDYISFNLNECEINYVENSWYVKFENGNLFLFEENEL